MQIISLFLCEYNYFSIFSHICVDLDGVEFSFDPTSFYIFFYLSYIAYIFIICMFYHRGTSFFLKIAFN